MFHAENRTVVLHVCIKMYQKRQKFPVNTLYLSYLIPFFLTTPPGIIKAPTKSVGTLFLGGLLALFCHKVTSMYNDVNLLIFMMDMLQ